MIRTLITEGINVNVTLLFSPERYRAVAQAYMDGLTERARSGRPLAGVASVASFFLSRIDTLVDKLLDELSARGQPAARTLRGKAAIASAARAYEIFEEIARDAAMADARRARRAAATAAVGLDLDQGPELQPHQVRRGADRAGDRQYHAARDPQRLPASRSPGTAPRAAHRRGPRCARGPRAARPRPRGGRRSSSRRRASTKFIEPFDKLQSGSRTRRRGRQTS